MVRFYRIRLNAAKPARKDTREIVRTIADALRNRRIEPGLTQAELRRELGTNRGTISQWESNRTVTERKSRNSSRCT